MFVKKLSAKDLATRNFKHWEVPSEKILRQAFDLFDINGDGVVDFDEIQKSMFRYFGLRLTKEETRSMLILYDTDESGSLCYEEFKIMIQNLESLDPASVGRFWMRQLGWFPPFKYFAKKFGFLGKVKRRRLLQDIDETQKLLDKSRAVLDLESKRQLDSIEENSLSKKNNNKRLITSNNKKTRHSMDDDVLYKRLLENKRRMEFQRLTGVRKHRGRIKTSPATMMKVKDKYPIIGLKSLNNYVPKLNPEGPTASRIKKYKSKVRIFQNGGDFRNPLRKRDDNTQMHKASRGDSSYNAKPKHWPPPLYRKEITYVTNGKNSKITNRIVTKEKLVRVVSKEDKIIKRDLMENKAKVARRKKIKNALKKSFSTLNAKSKNYKKYLNRNNKISNIKDNVFNENVAILQASTKDNRKHYHDNQKHNKSGKRRVSFSDNVYVHTIDRKL